MHVCMPTYCNVRCSWKMIRDLNRLYSRGARFSSVNGER